MHQGDREASPKIEWKAPQSPLREYAEVLLALACVTGVGWFVPLTYRALGHVYLLTVILLCLRVARWPALFAAVLSALTWNFVFIPPRLSFSVLTIDDALELGAYFGAALIAGQLTSRIRAQEMQERLREQRATALFLLTRALAGATLLDDAVHAALGQADELFGARTALLLADADGNLRPHRCGYLLLSATEIAAAAEISAIGGGSISITSRGTWGECLCIPMLRAGTSLGVFVLALPEAAKSITAQQRELIDAFAAHIALLLEREQLRAASEREKMLAESDRLHRTLLDSVSHEFKTPLAILRAATEGLSKSEPDRQAVLLEEIRTAMRRLDHLVANVLGQTRVEAGAVKPQLEWCDARDLIAATRKNLGEIFSSRKIATTIPPDMPMFKADAALCEHVLSNLLLNAIAHTPPETAISIVVGVDPRGQRVFLQVVDRGPGIAPEMRENLFQKFCRGHDARPGGIGLGLSIVRGFVLAQGGEVVAEDNPEGGAIFTVYLPFIEHSSVPIE